MREYAHFAKKGEKALRKYIKNLSKTSIMHYMKLFVRGSFFITAVILYLTGDIEAVSKKGIFPLIVWLWYFVEMVLRLFPTGMESMGCEKVFKKNYHPPKVEREPKNQSAKTTFIVAYYLYLILLKNKICNIKKRLIYSLFF